MAVFIITNLSYILFGVVIAAISLARFIKSRETTEGDEAPGPFKWPVIGNLHLLRGYAVPYQAFNHLSTKYGDVFSLQMGSVPAVVVHGADNIRQVLVHKGHHFDSRPNFNRYHQLFHGNKENSLAFCDWSELQRKRRDMLKDHTFPKTYTDNYRQLDRLICEEIRKLMDDIRGRRGVSRTVVNNRDDLPKTLRRLMQNKHVETIIRFPHYFKSESKSAESTTMTTTTTTETSVDVKEKLSHAIGNVFLRYFCSTDLSRDPSLTDLVRNFDEIFYEVNQGYAFDFLPFLGIFHRSQIGKIQRNSQVIRNLVLDKIVKGRFREMRENSPETDYLDSLLKTVKYPKGNDVTIDLETALFSLEDIIGGHSAISNFLVKLIQYLVANPEVQTRIREEGDRLDKDFITLDDRCHMPYTEAVVMETLRLLSSPIVPHVANQDTSIAGYTVKKDTLIFLNNYELNMSEELWSSPEKFDPSRFIDPETGAKRKPVHFLPFGGGKRSCMGYKLVQFLSFVFLANVINNFAITGGSELQDVSTGNLALPPMRPYKYEFQIRVK